MRAGSIGVVIFVLLAVGTFAFGATAVAPGADGSRATAADPAAEPADRCPVGPTEETRERADELNASEEPWIAGLYPDPTTDGNVGEFLVVMVADPDVLAAADWTITDGHTEAALSNETEAGRVALSMDPEYTEAMTDHPVAELEGHLRLAVDGDELILRRDGEGVDRVAYDGASEGDRWFRADGDAGEWWPRGATCRAVESVSGEEATSLVLPDAPTSPGRPSPMRTTGSCSRATPSPTGKSPTNSTPPWIGASRCASSSITTPRSGTTERSPLPSTETGSAPTTPMTSMTTGRTTTPGPCPSAS